MFIVCLLTWQAKREVEFQLKTTEICIGRGVFYVICSGAYSSIAALFSVYQNHLVGRSRRAENQRFICTRALRSWRDHVESSRQIPSSRPTELERYLLGACPGTDTVSSLTILPTAGNNTESWSLRITPVVFHSSDIGDNCFKSLLFHITFWKQNLYFFVFIIFLHSFFSYQYFWQYVQYNFLSGFTIKISSHYYIFLNKFAQ